MMIRTMMILPTLYCFPALSPRLSSGNRRRFWPLSEKTQAERGEIHPLSSPMGLLFVTHVPYYIFAKAGSQYALDTAGIWFFSPIPSSLSENEGAAWERKNLCGMGIHSKPPEYNQ